MNSVHCCFIFCCCCCFFCCRGSPYLTGKIRQEGSSPSYASDQRLGDFFTIMKYFWTTCESLYTTMRVAPQAAGLCRRWFVLGTKYQLLQSNNSLLWCERVRETGFHFSRVYTFSAMLSSLRNWANHDRYRLRPSTIAQPFIIKQTATSKQ